MDALIQRAASLLANARRVVVLSGAGMSKESGIPTFRDAQTGLWAQYDPQRLATMQGFRANPRLVWEWYQFRLGLVEQAQPHAGYQAVAALERLAPVVVITQNVDGLHSLAGSSDVLELHGNIRRFKCMRGHRGLTMDDLKDQQATPPTCPRPGCNALVRPDVVWFGEQLEPAILQRAYLESEQCDVMLIVGSSGVVHPAAGLPTHAWSRRARLVEINPVPSELSELAHILLARPAGEVLPALLAAVHVRRATAGQGLEIPG